MLGSSRGQDGKTFIMQGNMYEQTTFERDCVVVIVPDGNEITITEGSVGYITQLLGGNFTIQMSNGYLVRVAGKDADAIGREVEELPAPAVDDSGQLVVDEERVWQQLRLCYDPEIPINIVELGLIYDCEVAENEDVGYSVKVRMTLTAPGCGMGQVLVDDVSYRVDSIPGVTDYDVDLVFDPPWSPDNMSEAARLELGFD